MDAERWIVVRNWDRFQHYKDRNPPWIRLYTELAFKDEWEALTLPQRGLIVSIWVLYAVKNGQITVRSVRKNVGSSFRERSLYSLARAGFIEISASKPLAIRPQSATPETETETETETEPPPTPSASGGGRNSRLTAKELRSYTGCRWVRGSHGSTWIRDPLGMDKPPPDWSHPSPSRDEIEAALKQVAAE